MSKKIFISTPIYYPNNKLHIGHAYTTTLADFLSRYKKQRGYETFFLTGSDEHGQKLEDTAKELKVDTKTYIDEIVATFKVLWDKLGIDYDLFIRTTDETHKSFVKQKFTELVEANYIHEGVYKGFYCKPCESMFTEQQLEETKCPLCGREVDEIEEPTFFLEVSKFQDWIKEILETKNILLPAFRVQELTNNFLEDLKDLSVTRTNFQWGIQINENTKHVIYVWLDALLNYLSAFEYKEAPFSLEEIWGKDSDAEIVQFVGKEITRFHSIYWPIILKMLNLRLPSVYAHGWLLSNGVKMSKSLGNITDPIEMIETYSRDAIRFYLMTSISTGDDGKISNELVEELYNGILVNKYANLVSRTFKMIVKYRDGIIPDIKPELLDNFEITKNDFESKVDSFEYNKAMKTWISFLDEVNGYIDITQPWTLDGVDNDKLDLVLSTLINAIVNASELIAPVLIDSSKITLSQIDLVNGKLSSLEPLHLFERIK